MNSYKNLQFESSSMWSIWFILVLLVRTTIHNVVFIWIVIISHVLSKQLHSIELNSRVDFVNWLDLLLQRRGRKMPKIFTRMCTFSYSFKHRGKTAHGDVVWVVRDQSHITSVLEWSLFSQTKYGLHIPAASASPEEGSAETANSR